LIDELPLSASYAALSVGVRFSQEPRRAALHGTQEKSESVHI
jgi:hypothetical protein